MQFSIATGPTIIQHWYETMLKISGHYLKIINMMLHGNEATPLPQLIMSLQMNSAISLKNIFRAFESFWIILRVVEPIVNIQQN